MMNKYGYFKYADVAFGAKEDASYTTNEELQEGAALTQLSVGVEPYDFASFEKGAYITSKPKLLYKGQQNLGYLSKTISDENGLFETPISLIITFDNYYTTTGITINSKNQILDLEIVAYQNENEIARKSFVAESKNQFYPIDIELANKIEIMVKKIAEPFHFFGFFNIEYGTIRLFEESNFQNATIVRNFSVLGDTLEYDTLDLSIVDTTNENYLFQKKQPIDYIVNNDKKRIFYVNEGQKADDVITNLSCYDEIANLEDEFLGGIYELYNCKSLIDEIMEGKDIAYQVDTSVEGILIDGYIPITTRRKALQMLLLGANIRCFKRDKLYFEPIDYSVMPLVLSENNILQNPQKTKKQGIRSVTVKSHYYLKGTEERELYHWYISTTKNVTITFSSPMHNLRAYEVTGTDENGNDIVSTTQSNKVTFVKKSANYCIVSNKSNNKIVIKGFQYVESVEEHKKTNDIISNIGNYEDIVVDLMIMGSGYSEPICEDLYRLYSRKNSIKFLTMENLELGHRYNILGENLFIKSISQKLNGIYEVEAV